MQEKINEKKLLAAEFNIIIVIFLSVTFLFSSGHLPRYTSIAWLIWDDPMHGRPHYSRKKQYLFIADTVQFANDFDQLYS